MLMTTGNVTFDPAYATGTASSTSATDIPNACVKRFMVWTPSVEMAEGVTTAAAFIPVTFPEGVLPTREGPPLSSRDIPH
ncbi:hypothetical protein KH5H1_46020 [Corallococcus caeni]|nr:hypothetical protein KH5H1_46020 [Corallococcus sp. KH5-1]